jgi:hypothetical protein
MNRLRLAAIAVGVLLSIGASARAQGWTYGYTPVYGGYTAVAPRVYPTYTYYAPTYGSVAPRPAYVYAPAYVRPWPNYSYWVNAGYPFRTYSYYSNFSGAYPTYGYIYGYPYYATSYRAYGW